MAERDFKGVWIPKEIWLATDLGWSEKVLLVEIDSLDGEQGCFASNDYLADFFKLSKDRISRMVSSLRDKGYITVTLKYKEGTKQIDKRIIRVVKHRYHIGENTDTHRRKQREGIGENNDTPIGENTKDNNTSINNTFNNTDNITPPSITNRYSNSAPQADEGWKVVMHFYTNNIHPMPRPLEIEKLGFMYDMYPIAELVVKALETAVLNNAKNKIYYAESILKRWKELNYTTATEVDHEREGKQHGITGPTNATRHGRTPEEIAMFERLRTYSSNPIE